jgi:hypothetical protein
MIRFLKKHRFKIKLKIYIERQEPPHSPDLKILGARLHKFYLCFE